MKKLSLIAAIALTLTTCTTHTAGATDALQQKPNIQNYSFINFLIEHKKIQVAEARAEQMQKRIYELSEHVNKTWYVFSGSTPDGWDCSGLVMWFYSDFQVELEHSATAQKYSGKIVKKAKPGDIVGFSYNGSQLVYHNGIYIGNDLFIHSPRVGSRTRVSSVSEYAGEHSKSNFTRIDF